MSSEVALLHQQLLNQKNNSHSSVVLSRKVSHSITSAPSYLGYTSRLSRLSSGLYLRLESFFSFLVRASKRAFFITSVPLYWFLMFKFVLGYFEMGLFMFCVGLSYVLSTMSKDWGVLTWGLKG